MSNGANFASYLVGGRLDPPFMPTKTDPYIEGTIIESQGGKNDSKLVVTEDCELLSIAVGVSDYEPKDYWNLYVGDKLVCRNIFTKDVPEGMYLTAVIPCKAGTQFHLEYFNVGGKPKFVWVNYQMLK
ncbi:Low copy number virion structural protein [Paenibacillus sp. HJL G12]|uniref:Low copy number virion structural protein n=1 Tax=Paenibacillus dendrobii TaxID=2691084 RepID=A0A7X3IGF9_9BACL|nr:Low copy number virion structural protein [Paenibacillus dendrobii]MWV43093.1 Low copy number virion structural protein [Paenibacillus dendrobii]